MGLDDSKFVWYEVVSGSSLAQGDCLNNFPILIPPIDMPTTEEELENYEIIPDIEFINVIILTQSCDFQKMADNDLVALCHRSNFIDLYGHEADKGKGRWKPLIEGRIVDAHLLSKSIVEGYEFDYQVVILSKVFSIPYGYVKRFAEKQGNRIRLMPPYREHLAQSFAKRFMRVGLPLDLPKEFPYK